MSCTSRLVFAKALAILLLPLVWVWPAGANMIRNGDFQYGPDGTYWPSQYARYWASWGDAGREQWASVGVDGYAATVRNPSGATPDGGWYQDVACSPGLRYLVTCQLNAHVNFTWNSMHLKLEFYDTTRAHQLYAVTNKLSGVGQGGWTIHEVAGLAPSNAAWARVVFAANGCGTVGSISADDFKMYESPIPIAAPRLNQLLNPGFRMASDMSTAAGSSAHVWTNWGDATREAWGSFDNDGYLATIHNWSGGKPDGGWSQRAVAESGKRYRFMGMCIKDACYTAADLRMVCEFLDGDEAVLASVSTNLAAAPTWWTEYFVEASAPVGTLWARCAVEATGQNQCDSLKLDAMRFIEVPTPLGAISNRLTNPGFTNGLGGWSTYGASAATNTDSHDGDGWAMVLNGGGNSYLWQDQAAAEDQVFLFSGWFRSTNYYYPVGGRWMAVKLEWYTNTTLIREDITAVQGVGETWTYKEVEGAAPIGATRVRATILAENQDAAGRFYADDMRLLPVPARSYNRLEPEYGCYAGANPDIAFEEFNRVLDWDHVGSGMFQNMPDDYHAALDWAAETCRKNGSIFMVTVAHWGWAHVEDMSEQMANDFADWCAYWNQRGVPIFVRYGHEMNADWYYTWGMQPAKYRRAFRMVADAVHQRAPLTAMVWAPYLGGGYPYDHNWKTMWDMIYDANLHCTIEDWVLLDSNNDGILSSADDPYLPYYPGDEYVDWVGVSVYWWATAYPFTVNTRPWDRFFSDDISGVSHGRGQHDFYYRFAHERQKPLMLPETGCLYKHCEPPNYAYGVWGYYPRYNNNEADNKCAWVEQLFNIRGDTQNALDVANNYPMMKAIYYFSINKFEGEAEGPTIWWDAWNYTAYDGIVDWTLTSNPYVRSYYRQCVAGMKNNRRYFLRAGDLAGRVYSWNSTFEEWQNADPARFTVNLATNESPFEGLCHLRVRHIGGTSTTGATAVANYNALKDAIGWRDFNCVYLHYRIPTNSLPYAPYLRVVMQSSKTSRDVLATRELKADNAWHKLIYPYDWTRHDVSSWLNLYLEFVNVPASTGAVFDLDAFEAVRDTDADGIPDTADRNFNTPTNAPDPEPGELDWRNWEYRRLYTTPRGQVEYIEMYTRTNNQHALGGRELRSVSADGLRTNVYIFTGDYSWQTQDKPLLLATPGFQCLPGGIAPDYTIPAGFLFSGGGRLYIVGGVYTQAYPALPTDGRYAYDVELGATHYARPNNFSGQEGDLDFPTAGRGRVFWEGLYFNNSAHDPTGEAIPHPAYATNRFLAVDYVATNVTFHFLTRQPAGDGTVSAAVRLYPDGFNGGQEFQTQAVALADFLVCATNRFHNTPDAASISAASMLVNPSFETNGAAWVVFNSAGAATNRPRTGAYAMEMRLDSANWSGFYQDVVATTGMVYAWSIYACKDAAYNTSTWIKVEWRDTGDNQIGFVDYNINPALTTNWQLFTLTAVPTAGTAKARAVVVAYTGAGGGSKAYFDDAVFTNIPPVDRTETVRLWRAVWRPPPGFAGTVYYSPLVESVSGAVTDRCYLLRSLPTVTTNQGRNDFFWNQDAQVFGRSYYDVDYSLAWTNPVPLNYDWIYFNSSNHDPLAEDVPGLGGVKFFSFDHAGGPSHLFTLAPRAGVSSIVTRFDFINGGGETYRSGVKYTTTVISAAAPFHGQPSAGAVTLDVWRTTFYPPAGWSGTVFYAQRADMTADGALWLVRNLDDATGRFALANNWSLPQCFFSNYYDRDWSYMTTGAVSRLGFDADYVYHNATNVNAATEAVTGLLGRVFREVDYATTTTTFHVLTPWPVCVSPDDAPQVQLRIDYQHPQTGQWSPTTYDMSLVTSVVLMSGAPFHGLPAAGSRTAAIWRLAWRQPLGTNGQPYAGPVTVYYAPFIKTKFGPNGFTTAARYLVAAPGAPNAMPVNPQLLDADYYGRDYAYTNNRPWFLNETLDGLYFNGPASGAPETEAVPGLGGPRFLEYDYGTGPSYLYTLSASPSVTALLTRMDFIAGGGERYYSGARWTSVAINAAAPFHGRPAAGALTVDVWRTVFWPPAGWTGTVYLAQRADYSNGSIWLVRHLTNLASGWGYTNNWDPPQYLCTAGPVERDWSFAPTAVVARSGIGAYAYFNHTNLNPRTEAVPGLNGAVFLDPDYLRTTTVFRVLTDHPAAVSPEDAVTVQMRIDYNHPQTGWNPVYYTMGWTTNIVLTNGAGFHGAPVSGLRTMEVWRLDWPQPRYTNGTPCTNDLTIYFAPFIQTRFGPNQYVTGAKHLVAQGGTDNDYPINPQQYDADFFGKDYSYLHQWSGLVDGIPAWWWSRYGLSFTNKSANDNDNDRFSNGDEYVADTDPTNPHSYFSNVTCQVISGTLCRLYVNWSSTGRVYDAFARTNITSAGQPWVGYGFNIPGNGGVLTLTVTNTESLKFFRTGARLP